VEPIASCRGARRYPFAARARTLRRAMHEPTSIEVHAAAADTAAERPWLQRFGLRLVCAYLFLYSWPFPLNLVPWIGFTYEWSSGAWNELVLAAARLAHIEVPAMPAGSGDTTFNYVELPVRLALAALAALVWTLLPRRVSDARWRQLLVLHLRFVVALAMLGYGFAKVFPGQFAPPSLDRLTSTYGESSPMGLLWTFMGASRPYTIFGGALEVLGGVLLLFRPMAVLGALVSAGVLLNIVALNLCYDVPVKLYSSHLFLMASIVALPDARRLFAAVLGRAVPPRAEMPFATSTPGRIAVHTLHALVLLAITWNQVSEVRQTLAFASTPPNALSGLWLVESRTVEGELSMPLPAPTDPRSFSFTNFGSVTIRDHSGGAERFRFTLDEEQRTVALTPFGTPTEEVAPRTFAWQKSGDELVLRETGASPAVEWHLRERPASSFLLMERGFHWINEFPFNR
jgi:uncharacterized membrane protein YphA (DoxX/SURF4 family)